MGRTDQELLARLRTDPAAFEELYLRHVGKIVAAVTRRAGDPAEVRDLVAAAFTRIHESVRRYDPARSSPLPWMLGVTGQVVAERHVPVVPATPAPPWASSRRALEAAQRARLERRMRASAPARRRYQAMMRLPPRERAMVELVELDGLTHIQAAEALGVWPSLARLRLSRAERKLARSAHYHPPPEAVANAGTERGEPLDEVGPLELELLGELRTALYDPRRTARALRAARHRHHRAMAGSRRLTTAPALVLARHRARRRLRRRPALRAGLLPRRREFRRAGAGRPAHRLLRAARPARHGHRDGGGRERLAAGRAGPAGLPERLEAPGGPARAQRHRAPHRAADARLRGVPAAQRHGRRVPQPAAAVAGRRLRLDRGERARGRALRRRHRLAGAHLRSRPAGTAAPGRPRHWLRPVRPVAGDHPGQRERQRAARLDDPRPHQRPGRRPGQRRPGVPARRRQALDPLQRQPVERPGDHRHRARRGLLVQAAARRRSAACRLLAARPGRPGPMCTPSTPTTGMTSATVDDRNASSAPTRSSALNTPSTTR